MCVKVEPALTENGYIAAKDIGSPFPHFTKEGEAKGALEVAPFRGLGAIWLHPGSDNLSLIGRVAV